MDLDAFLEVFNTLYAVSLVGDVDADSLKGKAKKKNTPSPAAQATVFGSREGRCEGVWEKEGCGGR